MKLQMNASTKTVRSVGGETLTYETTNGIGEDKENARICPISGTKGIRLRQITMTSHVFPKYWSFLTEKGFYFCMEVDCPVIYFNKATKSYFGQSELRAPVMQKMAIQSEGRPMCYCMGVLEKQVLDELLIKKCCDSLQDIQEYTGANLGKDCKITNPAGRCCGRWVKEVIDWAKDKRLEIASPLLEEATSCCEVIIENGETSPLGEDG